MQGPAKPESWAALLWHLLALGYWRDKLALLWQNAFGMITGPYIPPRTHARLRREARLLIALYGVGAAYSVFVSPILIRLWLIPMVLGFPVLRFYLLAEHARCAHVPNMFANSRTVLTGPLIRMLAWNMPYHAEHHCAPNVPFHRLGDLHRLIRAHLEVTESGYLRFARRYVAGFSENGKPPRTVSSQ